MLLRGQPSAALDREGAITKQPLRQRRHDQEERVLPATASACVDPAIGDVHPSCHGHDRHQRQSRLASIHTEHQSEAAQQLGGENGVGQSAWDALAVEELSGAWQREDDQLEQRMRHPHHP